MLGGEIDVFVWEELQRSTAAVWQQGKLVRVVGAVRDRGEDRVSISAVSVDEHVVGDSGDSGAEPAAAPAAPTERVETGAAGRALQPPGPIGSTNGAVASQDDQPVRRRLSLRIVESGEPERDVRLLQQLVRTLLEHTGDDEVGMEIATAGSLVQLDWPRLGVAATDELASELADLLGDSGRVAVLG